MGRFQPFNDLPASQQEALKRDIEARGVVNPILVDEDDKTIDGHQRRRVAAELGIECPKIVLPGLTDDEKMSLAIALNTFRRHLTGTERSQALQKMALLGMSQRRIADATGIPRRTVRRVLSGGPDGPPDEEPTRQDHVELGASFGTQSGDPSGSPDELGPQDHVDCDGEDSTKVLSSPAGVDPETGERLPEREAPPSTSVDSPAPRVVGKDGKSYPATKPAPAPRALTPEEQAAEDRKGQIRRAAARLEQFVNGWIEFQNFHSNRDRDEILALLIPEDRAVILDVESRFMIGASQ